MGLQLGLQASREGRSSRQSQEVGWPPSPTGSAPRDARTGSSLDAYSGCLRSHQGPPVAARSQAEIEPRFPAPKSVSGWREPCFLPEEPSNSGGHCSRMAGPERRGPEGRPGTERKESSREGDFPDSAGEGKVVVGGGGQLTHTGQGLFWRAENNFTGWSCGQGAPNNGQALTEHRQGETRQVEHPTGRGLLGDHHPQRPAPQCRCGHTWSSRSKSLKGPGGRGQRLGLPLLA